MQCTAQCGNLYCSSRLKIRTLRSEPRIGASITIAHPLCAIGGKIGFSSILTDALFSKLPKDKAVFASSDYGVCGGFCSLAAAVANGCFCVRARSALNFRRDGGVDFKQEQPKSFVR
jgi:hypothetical protein